MFRVTSLRDLLRENQRACEQLLARYYPLLQRAFPLPGEIETVDTYLSYLKDANFTWDALILLDSESGEISGGIQLQLMREVHEEVGDAFWVEHIWIHNLRRTFRHFRELLRVIEQRVVGAGARFVFMEWNDPRKMTPEEIEDDQKGGIATNDRVLLWASVGVCELLTVDGKTAPYAQPSMDGQPAVRYLSLGMVGFDAHGVRELADSTFTIDAYLALIEGAHGTIPGYDSNSDPTAIELRTALRAYSGTLLRFSPMMRRFS